MGNPRPQLGAVPIDGGTRFCVWSSTAREVAVRIFAAPDRVLRTEPLEPGLDGYFTRTLAEVSPGALYKLVLDGRELPDPYGRFFPFGVHGPARVERPCARRAGETRAFSAPPLPSWAIYEIHVGAFTPEGTWAAACTKLDALSALGVNVIEVMPIAAFPGTRGWGYDGVALFAPFAKYGEPDDLRAFVAACHERGLAVILDVVYNHFGPAGNYLSAYSPAYFTAKHKTAWGDAPDFTEPHLRSLVLENARYWLDEFDFDGLRLDATHAIADDSPRHVLADLAALAASFEPPRILIAEDERNDSAIATQHRIDAVWADDFHHVVHVLLTGERDGYYAAYEPSVADLARTIDQGWLYQGETYAPWKTPRGRPAPELAASSFVYSLQNHDQIGNRPLGTRLHHDAGVDAYTAAAMLLLFLPMVPLLFMGEEWAASSPFLFFTDHDSELGAAITRGRHEEFAHFRGFTDPEVRDRIPDPQARSTFESSKLHWDERSREPHAHVLDVYRRMLALRASDPVLSAPSRARTSCSVHGSLLSVRRWVGPEERALLFNAGDVAVAAPFPLAGDDVLLSSTPLGALTQATPLPARSSVLLRRRT
jgi:maltooligosyltrehalose trehalohydrolase